MIKYFLNRGLILMAALFSSVAMLAQPVCNQFDYYYADITNPSSGKQTDIYAVSFGGGDAILTPIAQDLPYGAHIAFNQDNKLIYVVDESNGDIRTLDPITGVISLATPPSISLTKVTTAAINADGKLLIGNDTDDNIYKVDMSSNPYGVTVYDSGADISGGDLAWTDSGLFLASKPNGYLYLVLPGMLNVLQGSVNSAVTGLATMADGQNVVVSSVGNSNFVEYSLASGVTEVTSYAAMLNGEAFTMSNGDMTSGCSSFADNTGCQDFQYFYINDNGPDVPTGTVMSGTIVGSDFVLTSLFETGIAGHLAVNTDNGDFYVLRNNRVKTYSSTGVLLNDITITGLPSRVESAVWNPADNLVYVASSSANKVYQLNPSDGSHTLFASNIPTNGGDLILNDAGELFIVERFDNSPSKLFNISSGSPVFVANVNPGVNGAAIASDGSGFIMAYGDGGTTFHMYAADGTPGAVLNAVDNVGNPMTIEDGDMASGCFGGSNPSSSSCTYSLFYTHFLSQSSSELLSLTIMPDNSVTSSVLANISYGSTSAAVSPEGVLYVPSRFGQGFFTAWDVTNGSQIGGNVSMTTSGGANIQNVGGATFHNGLLYVNSLNGTVYALDPLTGVSQSEIVHGHDNGSDLEFDPSGDLWLISRDAGIFYNLTAGTSFSVALDNIDGIALMDNGNFAAVNGDNGSTMYEVDQNAGILTGNTYDLGFSVQYGDLASACIDNENNDIPGQCYATEVIEYVEGTSHSGGSIALNRTDASKALGAPERVDQLVFVSLGYGGSLTLAFDGSVPNGPGDDIEVVETTYNNTSCDTYPEFADVYVSVDGNSWTFVKTVCRADGMVDISDADPNIAYVNYVKIVNNNELSTTPDAFDVDGVVAIHNCEDAVEPRPAAVEAQESLSAYPSPTTGPATIEFEAAKAGKSTLDIIDMNGRLVKTIFNENVVAGQTYSVDFDGSDLPNGIYITKLTTDNNIVVGKIMIAK